MKKRSWTSKQKSQIVLEGLSGRIEVSKLCNKYEISQGQYYKWRDQFLQTCHQAFETKDISKKEQKLKDETQKLKKIIADLTVELKKNEFEY
jgi:transposase-like protein